MFVADRAATPDVRQAEALEELAANSGAILLALQAIAAALEAAKTGSPPAVGESVGG